MTFISNLWMIVNQFSPYLILGCLVAGILSIFLTVEIIQKYLGKGKLSSVFIASLLGVPLPLCSCGVIPVSAYLHKHGASKGATTSFLISTPQTGVDSIFLTYGMLGPIFAIYRPIIALISGILGGSLVHLFDNDTSKIDDSECEDDCCDDSKSKSILYRILNYGFVRLPLDIVNPLIVGILLSSMIIIFIPADYFEMYGSGITGMIIMLLLGLPTYVCATASVPLAFALFTKGFSLGAMLVFLMTGPATNITTMSVIYKILGRKNLLIYLSSIIFCSIGAGLMLDIFVPPPQSLIISNYNVNHIITPNVQLFCSVIFIGIILNSLKIKYFTNTKLTDNNLANLLLIEGMTCSHCEESVKKSLLKIKGISDISIELSTGRIEYIGDSKLENKVVQAIKSLGYKIKV